MTPKTETVKQKVKNTMHVCELVFLENLA